MGYEFKIEPFPYQLEEWEKSKDETARGIFWEQGLGKSKLTIDTAGWLHSKEKIDCVIIVAPNGVHRNWIYDELPAHFKNYDQVDSFCFNSSKSNNVGFKKSFSKFLSSRKFLWFAISYDAFTTANGKRCLIELLHQRKVLFIVDEAHNIKNPSAQITKSILKAGTYAHYRRILTGTPISVGPFDTFSQIRFLNPEYWAKYGLDSYAAFKSYFGVFKKIWNPNLKARLNEETGKWEKCNGGKIEIITGFKNIAHLNEMLAPVSTRLLKEEVLKFLPEKLYTKRYFQLSPEQEKIYRTLEEDYLLYTKSAEDGKEEKTESEVLNICNHCEGKRYIEQEGFIYSCEWCQLGGEAYSLDGIPVESVLTRMIRLQQIMSGFVPTEDGSEPFTLLPGKNNRLELFLEVIQATQGKVIVWARFTKEIEMILEELDKLGIKAVRYDGKLNDEEKAESKYLFKGFRPLFEDGKIVDREEIPVEKQAKVFVGNPAAGATGLTLTEANTVIYYSNSLKYIDRKQSEDRAHRIGQLNKVLYLDIIAESTLDEEIVNNLRKKFALSSDILGDKLSEWI